MLSPLETIHEYDSVFSTLDLNAIASYYLEPSIGTRAVFSAASRADVARAFAPFIERLREKGYGHSEFVEPQITMLTDTAALVRGFAVRYAKRGEEIERATISYLLHSDGTCWKIAVAVLPD